MRRVTALLLASASAHAMGSINRTTIPVPGGFVQAGVTPVGKGAFPIVGSDFEPYFDGPDDDFNEVAFAGPGPVLQAASASTANSSGSASAEAGMGVMRFVATNMAPNAGFGNAGAHGGFKENFVVTGGTPGAQAWMLVDVSVHGTMDAAGFAGRALLTMGAFKDDQELRSSEPFWDNGASDAIGTDRQRAQWAIATASFNASDSRVVNDMITFSVPVTLGQPFNLGMYGFADAGKRSSSGVAGSSSASVNFGNGIACAGARVVDAGGAVIPGAVISGDSGVNWAAGVACPADLAAPYGTLDFFDVSAFLSAYNAHDPAADLAAPFGTFDFFDVSAFLSAYNAGCP